MKNTLKDIKKFKAKCNSTFGFNLDKYDFDSSVEIWIDTFNGVADSNADTKIFVGIEPQEIIGKNQSIINNKYNFDYILTYDENLLETLDNAVLFEYGTKWVEIDKYDYPEKEFSVSTVCGHKSITKSHRQRQKLWMSQDKIEIKKNFFLSKFGGPKIFEGNKVLGDSKFPLFDSMFHICIENVPKKYFFTEKLIDCLLCKTIPIYVGCSNVEDYFNVEGIILAKDNEDIIKICNSLTEEDYQKRINAIEENYEKALKWTDLPERLAEKIKEIIE
jgi:hypothetical protein